MSDNPIFNYISSVAVSLTMAGNTGISPFLTLLILGVLEMAQPELLNMGPTMEMLLSSWWAIGILGILAIAEMVGKCVPALDEVIDSVEVFVVPFISILSTLATMGLFNVPSQDDAGLGQKVNVGELFGEDGEDRYRYLQDTLDPNQDIDGFSEGFITFTKVSLVGIGMALALAIHVFKMLIRVSSLTCSGGCCQPCITIIEYVLVAVGVILAIVAPVVAIIASIAFIVAAGYVIRKKCCKTTEGNEKKECKATKDTYDNRDDVENQSTLQAATAQFTEKSTSADTDGFEDVPLPAKLDVEAKTY